MVNYRLNIRKEFERDKIEKVEALNKAPKFNPHFKLPEKIIPFVKEIFNSIEFSKRAYNQESKFEIFKMILAKLSPRSCTLASR